MKRTVLMASLVLAIGLACTPGIGVQPSTLTGDPIPIGVPLSLTGSHAATSTATLVKQGYELWAEWVNARGGLQVQGVMHKVNLVYEDDHDDVTQAAQATQKLIIDDKARFLLGPYGSTLTEAAARVANDAHVILISCNGASRTIYSHGYQYLFGVQSPADEYLQGVIDMSQVERPAPTKVAILAADDLFSKEVAMAAQDYATSKGLIVVYTAQYPNGSTVALDQVKAAKEKKPDLLLNSGHLSEAIAVHKAARQVGLDAKLFAYTVGPAEPEFIHDLGKAADYVVTPSQWSPDVKYAVSYFMTSAQYVAAYQEKFATDLAPSYQTAESSAGAVALGKAIENANSLETESVRRALQAMDMSTWFGRIKFDDNGLDSHKPMVVEQIQGGKLMTVWPPDVSHAEPSYPTPPWSTRPDV